MMTQAFINGGTPVTLQEMYDKAKARIQETGLSRNTTGCLYRLSRGPDKKPAACAVGALLSDEACTSSLVRHNPSMETVKVTHDGWVVADQDCGGDLLAKALTESGIPATRKTWKLLDRLQDAHDEATDTADALGRMASVAVKFNLIP